MTRLDYFQLLSKLAEGMCAPFWWSLQKDVGKLAHILNNGTICYVNTGTAELGVTANHVYKKGLEHLEECGELAMECQFGGSTIHPQKHVISQSNKWDLATFAIPEVFVTASQMRYRTHHHAPKWPPDRLTPKERVLYGGHPGILREEKGRTADLPFQWFSGFVSDIGQVNVVLEPFNDLQWRGHDPVNKDLGGFSGGPVFRVLDETHVSLLELAGFIHGFIDQGEVVLARHADLVLADGQFAA